MQQNQHNQYQQMHEQQSVQAFQFADNAMESSLQHIDQPRQSEVNQDDFGNQSFLKEIMDTP